MKNKKYRILLGLVGVIGVFLHFSHKRNTLEFKEFWDTRYNNKSHTQPTSGLCDDDAIIGKNRKKNWTIILTVNDGYFDFFLNWFAAYQRLHADIPIVVVTEDKLSYKRLTDLCLKGITTKMSKYEPIYKTVSYGSGPFNDLSVRRHTYVLQYLQAGNDVIFSDTDTVWIKNPVQYFVGDYDIWMLIDRPKRYCPGTMAIKSNEHTTEFFRLLTFALKAKPQADQPFINTLLNKSKSVIRLKGLDTKKFPSGYQYFDQYNLTQRSDAVVVHNNWIIGHTAKLNRFKNNNLWFLKDSPFLKNILSKLGSF